MKTLSEKIGELPASRRVRIERRAMVLVAQHLAVEEVSAMEPESEYWFSKDKLPRDHSWPLKRSVLDAALETAGVREHVYSVRYLFSNARATPLIEVQSTPVGKDVHPFARDKSLITVWSVPGTKRKETEGLLLSSGLTALCSWLGELAEAPETARSVQHHLSLSMVNGSLAKSKS